MADSLVETKTCAILEPTTHAAYPFQILESQVNVMWVVTELEYEVQEQALVCSESQECLEQLAKKW